VVLKEEKRGHEEEERGFLLGEQQTTGVRIYKKKRSGQ